MYSEVVSISIDLPIDDTESIMLIETLLAPATVVKALADFLSCREEEEYFTVSKRKIYFTDCSVKIGDSKQVVKSFLNLKSYNLPLTTYSIGSDLIKFASIEEDVAWKNDNNLSAFIKWYEQYKQEEEE